MDSKYIASVFISIIIGASGVYLYTHPMITKLNTDVLVLEHINEDYEIRIINLERDVNEQNNQISYLLEQNNDLISQVTDAQSEIDDLQSQNTDLKDQISQQAREISSLQSQKTTLQNSLNNYMSSYQTLLDSHDDLETAFLLEQELRIGNSLESYYDVIREGLGPSGTKYWWHTPETGYWQQSVDFACSLAEHDIWRIYWPDYEPDYMEITGENSYETAWYKLQDILDIIEISDADGDVIKITKILNFLNANIHYESEINDVFLAPVETLGFKSGDCDDYSILAAAFFELLDIETAIGFFVNDDEEYHAMALVKLDDLESYGVWYFDDLTKYGIDEGKWIVIEPQMTIDMQDDEWISQWSIFVAAEITNTN